MRFFQGVFTVIAFYTFCILLIYFSKQFGIQRGIELGKKESNIKLQECHTVLGKTSK